jgi:hypothetical protein
VAALARKPGRPATQHDWQFESAGEEIAQLTEAVEAQAIELAVVRGKSVVMPSGFHLFGGGVRVWRWVGSRHGGPSLSADGSATAVLAAA